MTALPMHICDRANAYCRYAEADHLCTVDGHTPDDAACVEWEYPNPDSFERCVLCGAETKVKVSTPVDQREGYIVGAGQVCPDCYGKL